VEKDNVWKGLVNKYLFDLASIRKKRALPQKLEVKLPLYKVK